MHCDSTLCSSTMMHWITTTDARASDVEVSIATLEGSAPGATTDTRFEVDAETGRRTAFFIDVDERRHDSPASVENSRLRSALSDSEGDPTRHDAFEDGQIYTAEEPTTPEVPAPVPVPRAFLTRGPSPPPRPWHVTRNLQAHP